MFLHPLIICWLSIVEEKFFTMDRLLIRGHHKSSEKISKVQKLLVVIGQNTILSTYLYNLNKRCLFENSAN